MLYFTPHVLYTYTRTVEVHQTLCIFEHIDFSTSDLNSENYNGDGTETMETAVIGLLGFSYRQSLPCALTKRGSF
jgi:hypothetical protein